MLGCYRRGNKMLSWERVSHTAKKLWEEVTPDLYLKWQVLSVSSADHPHITYSLRRWDLSLLFCNCQVSQLALVVKNLPANTGDVRDTGLIPWLVRSSGGRHGNPVQYSCLENPLDRGAWWATVHRVTKSWTWLKQLGTQINFQVLLYSENILKTVGPCFRNIW